MQGEVRVRPATATDVEVIFRVFASARDETGAQAGWADARRETLLRQLFDEQERHFRAYFPDAERGVVEIDGAPAGRLYVQRRAVEMLLLDITLFPERRCQGVGTALLRDLQERACADRVPLRLVVEGFNPARRLFERLGFVEVGQEGRYRQLEWRPVIA